MDCDYTFFSPSETLILTPSGFHSDSNADHNVVWDMTFYQKLIQVGWDVLTVLFTKLSAAWLSGLDWYHSSGEVENETKRKHSSRIHTIRSLLHGVSLSRRISVQKFSVQGFLCSGGLCPKGLCQENTLPLGTEWLTDRCKNITFPQLRLRAAKKCYISTRHWRIQGGAPGMRAPPGGPNSFIFMQFSAKMWKIIAILGVGAPPPWGKSWIRHCKEVRFLREFLINSLSGS